MRTNIVVVAAAIAAWTIGTLSATGVVNSSPSVTATPDSIYVSSLNTASKNEGTLQNPALTLARGVELARSRGVHRILVSIGVYDGAVDVPEGMEIEGGYGAHFFGAPQSLDAATLTKRDRSVSAYFDADKKSGATVLKNSSGPYVLSIVGGTTPVAIRDIVVIGSDRASGSGETSYAVRVMAPAQGAIVAFTRTKVIGGNGGSGHEGVNGSAGNSYVNAGGGGGAGYSQDGDVRCGSRGGADGQDASNGNATIKGGKGGEPGKSECNFSFAEFPPPTDGKRGNPGLNGDIGASGKPIADRLGYFDDTNVWKHDPGGQGAAGGAGSGGGGGGAGGSMYARWFWCDNELILGGTGGAGGAGGAGGGPGIGGEAGGSSFPIVASSVHLTLDHVAVLIGNAGAGGAGGAAGDGKTGATGANGYSGAQDRNCTGWHPKRDRSGDGGLGGKGGNGGAGGPGAGGNGGDSIAVALLNGATSSNPFFTYGGRPGAGGPAGRIGGVRANNGGLSGSGGILVRFERHR